MKSLFTFLSFLLVSHSSFGIPGIPEPGAVFFGRVTAGSPVATVDIGSMEWTISDPSTSRSITYSMANGSIEKIVNATNGEVGFILRVPFVTRSVPGLQFDPYPRQHSNCFPHRPTTPGQSSR